MHHISRVRYPRCHLGHTQTCQPIKFHSCITVSPRHLHHVDMARWFIQQHFNTPGTHTSHMAFPSSNSTHAKSKVVKQNSFDATKIKWDSKIDTFSPVKAALWSYCMIAQMGYIVHPQFLREYELGLHSGIFVYDFHSTYVDSDGNSLTALTIFF